MASKMDDKQAASFKKLHLMPMKSKRPVTSKLPAVTLDEDEAQRIRLGKPTKFREASDKYGLGKALQMWKQGKL